LHLFNLLIKSHKLMDNQTFFLYKSFNVSYNFHMSSFFNTLNNLYFHTWHWENLLFISLICLKELDQNIHLCNSDINFVRFYLISIWSNNHCSLLKFRIAGTFMAHMQDDGKCSIWKNLFISGWARFQLLNQKNLFFLYCWILGSKF